MMRKANDESQTVARRQSLLKEYFELREGLDDVRLMIAGASGLDAQRLLAHEKYHLKELSRLRSEYKEILPLVEISRCPFTGEVMRHSLDKYGLDGLWWDYDAPIRLLEHLPATCFALAGAVRLSERISWSSFICKPGPEVPYVSPRLLEHQSIIAVLSSIMIGEHQGYIITYFADPVPYDIPRINTWGAGEYLFISEQGEHCWDTYPENPRDFDFELQRWITGGKLRWIAPGDQSLTLHDTVDDCPYLKLSGRQRSVPVYKGEVWDARTAHDAQGGG